MLQGGPGGQVERDLIINKAFREGDSRRPRKASHRQDGFGLSFVMFFHDDTLPVRRTSNSPAPRAR